MATGTSMPNVQGDYNRMAIRIPRCLAAMCPHALNVPAANTYRASMPSTYPLSTHTEHLCPQRTHCQHIQSVYDPNVPTANIYRASMIRMYLLPTYTEHLCPERTYCQHIQNVYDPNVPTANIYRASIDVGSMYACMTLTYLLPTHTEHL
jgi:hypothetical protein